MSSEALERALAYAKSNNQSPKAVIVVHLYGQSTKMDELMTVCKKYNVPLIEEAAESLGSKYKGVASGSIVDYSIYSLNLEIYIQKNILKFNKKLANQTPYQVNLKTWQIRSTM